MGACAVLRGRQNHGRVLPCTLYLQVAAGSQHFLLQLPCTLCLQMTEGSLRFLIHFEGWTEKWDEWVVLPTEWHRLRNFNGGRVRMGQRQGGAHEGVDAGCLLGATYGLQVFEILDMLHLPLFGLQPTQTDQHSTPKQLSNNRGQAAVIGVSTWEFPQDERGHEEYEAEGGWEALVGAQAGDGGPCEVHILLRCHFFSSFPPLLLTPLVRLRTNKSNDWRWHWSLSLRCSATRHEFR